jgi:hypothetical protein
MLINPRLILDVYYCRKYIRAHISNCLGFIAVVYNIVTHYYHSLHIFSLLLSNSGSYFTP